MVRKSLVAVILLCVLSISGPHHAVATGEQFFPETGHSITGRFLEYWQANGGLAQFGFPLTDAVPEQNADTGATYTVQYFERARFEYHPEQSVPNDVLLGRLGAFSLAQQGIDWQTFPRATRVASGCQFFAETGHSLCEPFLSYWRDHGGLTMFGLPLSEPHAEAIQTDGRKYTVQHFERTRFEYHPENAEPYRVQLGLLGGELYANEQLSPTLQRVVQLVNAERRQAGLVPLRVSRALTDAAQSYSHTQAQQGKISHTGPDGSNAGQRLNRAGYAWKRYGENLGAGYADADAVVAGWMNSHPHRANILNPYMREVGAGLTQHQNDPSRLVNYWVLEVAVAR